MIHSHGYQQSTSCRMGSVVGELQDTLLGGGNFSFSDVDI